MDTLPSDDTVQLGSDPLDVVEHVLAAENLPFDRTEDGDLAFSLAGDWKPQQYHDTYAEELRKRIDAKDKGKDVVEETAPDEGSADVLDLMAALEKSVAKAKSTRKRSSSRATTKPKRKSA